MNYDEILDSKIDPSQDPPSKYVLQEDPNFEALAILYHGHCIREGTATEFEAPETPDMFEVIGDNVVVHLNGPIDVFSATRLAPAAFFISTAPEKVRRMFANDRITVRY